MSRLSASSRRREDVKVPPDFFENRTFFYGLAFRPHVNDETVTEKGIF